MDISQVMYGFNGKYTLCHVKPRYIFRKNVIFHQHSHQISSRKEFHDEVEIQGILEGVEQLYDPRGCGLGEDVSLCSHMSQLRKSQ